VLRIEPGSRNELKAWWEPEVPDDLGLAGIDQMKT
jgi:hypothetical protein